MTTGRIDMVLVPILAACAAAPVASADPDCDVREALESAASHLSATRPDAALHALSCVSGAEPDNPWLWYYTGAAHLQRGDSYAAMTDLHRAAELLRDAAAPDPSLSRRIRDLYDAARRSVVRLSLRFGTAYDTNVTFLDDTAATGDLVAGEEDGVTESRFAVTFAPIKTHEHTLTLGAEVANTWHYRVDEFDTLSYAGFARYAARAGAASEVAVRYDWDIVDLDNRSYLSRNAFTLSWRYEWRYADQPARLLDTQISYRVEHRDFHYRVDRDFRQDGLVQSVGAAQRFVLRPVREVPWQCTGELGYSFSIHDTKGRQYDRDSHRAYVNLEMPLLRPAHWDEYLLIPDKPLWLTLTYDLEYALYDTARATERSRGTRRDLTNTCGATLSQVILRGRHGDLTLHVHAWWMDAESNLRTASGAAPFTFDKFVVGVQFEWSW